MILLFICLFKQKNKAKKTKEKNKAKKTKQKNKAKNKAKKKPHLGIFLQIYYPFCVSIDKF